MTRLLAAIAGALLLPLAASGQALSGPAGPAHAALRPDTVLTPPGGPRIVLLSAPGEGVAALRLAVPLREGPAEAGAGWLLREMALERMEALARPVGAGVAASRTPWGIAYAVVGAAADFEYLAYLLREAVALPAVETPAFVEALARLEEAAATAVETPGGRLASDLRGQAAPAFLPHEGTPASVRAMDGARVREVWARSHQASAMTLVVSGPVIPEVILAATRGMGAPETAAAPPLDAPPPPASRLPAPQALRSWYGEAWYGGAPTDPHGPVAARLVADALRAEADGFEASVALSELPDRWVVSVVGAAYGARAAPMRRAVSAALVRARDALDPAAVAGTVAALNGELLLGARTPAGLVRLVGRALEATGDPGGAAAYMEALGRVDAASTRAFLEELLARGPVRAEVRP